MTVLVEVNRNVHGALYHAKDLDSGLDAVIEGFGSFAENVEIASQVCDLFKTCKKTNLQTIQYLERISALTNKDGSK